MLYRRGKRLSFPALALVTAFLGTAALLFVATIRSQNMDRRRMDRQMELQSTAIIRTLEAGARTGMMMRWGRSQIQALLEEAAGLPEIAYLGLYTEEGQVVAAFGADGKMPPEPGAPRLRKALQEKTPLFSFRIIAGERIFEAVKRFVPAAPGGRGMMRHMMGSPPAGGEQDWVVVLGMRTGAWEDVLEEGRRQMMLSLLVILIAGSLALYLGIVLQNHLVVRRTLSEMRAYAQEVMENMADGLLSVDGKGVVDSFNAEAALLFGKKKETALSGRLLQDLLPESGAHLERVLEGQREKEEFEVTIGGAGEDRPAWVSLSPLQDEEGNISGAVILLRDLTEIRRLQAKIREAEKLAAIGQMAAAVAHEVRNPLSSLKGFAQLFEGKFPEGSPEAGYAGLMVREVDRLNSTVTDLLFFSRPLEPDRKAVGIRALLAETAELLQPDFQSKGQRVVIAEGDEVEVPADRILLSRLCINLLLNSREALGEGGEIRLEVSREGEEWCRIRFRDTGPGMSEEEIARAFEPFFTTREKGSGLGLAIVRKITDLHGGRVAIESPPGEGTEVVLDLPLRAPEGEGADGA